MLFSIVGEFVYGAERIFLDKNPQTKARQVQNAPMEDVNMARGRDRY
jgi:hypothetical protein